MVGVNFRRAVGRPERVGPSTPRLKELLGQWEDLLEFEDVRFLLRKHLNRLRVPQQSPSGEKYWTLVTQVDRHEVVFRLAGGQRWDIYVEHGTADRVRESIIEDLLSLAAGLWVEPGGQQPVCATPSLLGSG